MFEQKPRSGTGGDGDGPPLPPEAQAFPGCSDDVAGVATSGAPCWREMMPGPEMIAALADVSLQRCSDSELLDVLAGWQRAEAWLAAQQTRVLDRTSSRLLETAVRDEDDLDGSFNWNVLRRQVETEISTALRWTSRFTLHRLDVADQLAGRLPSVLDAMAAGQLTWRHAEMICEETVTLTERQARHVVDRLLPEASTKTVGGLRRRLRKACLQLDPDTANERAARAATERSVTIRPLPDGQAQLRASGPAAAVLAMFRVLNDTASRSGTHEPRTQTARRFDALSQAVLGPTDARAGSWPYGGVEDGSSGWSGDGTAGSQGCPPPVKVAALVQLTMDLPTLLGLQDNPAELHGYGPLPAALARQLAIDADWQRFIQDPVTGAPQDLGRTRRHPDAGLRRWIIARDRTCLFPECYRPAKDCEPDHNPDWQFHGRTDKDKLHQLCPKHHKVRHHGWSYQRHPDRITWTSPTGRLYERYLTEADLIGPDDRHPHLDHNFDDVIWPARNDDQRIRPFLPQPWSRTIHEFQPPAQKIPWEIVEAFQLDDSSTWPCDTDGNPVKPLVLTPEEKLAIFEHEDHLIYGDPKHEYNNGYRSRRPAGRTTTRAWDDLPDDPPF